MSFKNPKIERPYERTIQWKGSGGGSFTEYDKDTKQNNQVDVNEFIVLEEMSSISGFSESDKKGVWSNEVMDLQTELIHVRVGNEVRVTGVYKDIKAEVKAIGGKYTNVVFGLLDGKIVRFLFAGSGCSGWIDKGFNPMSLGCGVRFTGQTEGKKGAVVYAIPLFEKLPLSDDQKQAAYDACDTLTAWLESQDKDYVPADQRQGDSEQNQELDDPNAELNQEADAYQTAQDEVPF